MVVQVNRKRSHNAETDQYETRKIEAALFIFEQTHIGFVRNESEGRPENTKLPLIPPLDGMRLFWICKYGRFFDRGQERKGASSQKGRRVGWLIPEGGEDPSLARGFRRGGNRSNLRKN